MSSVLVFSGTVMKKAAGSFDGKPNFVTEIGWLDLEAGQAGNVSLYLQSAEELEKFPAKGSNVRVFVEGIENKKSGMYRKGKILKVESLTGPPVGVGPSGR